VHWASTEVLLFCTRVNRGLLTICTDSTEFIPASIYAVYVNCNPLWSPATHYYWLPLVTHSSGLLSCSVFVPRTRTLSVLIRLGWLSLIVMYSGFLYCYFSLNITGCVIFNTASYSEDAAVVLTVHWIANPPVPIRYIVYRAVVVYLLTKDLGMISSIRLCCSLHLLVAVDYIKSLFY
jgi:hypothetical protein